MSKAISKKDLFQSISSLIKEAQQHIVRNINTTMLITYFEIGRMIVEDEQNGKSRATYAKEVLKSLSVDLTKEFGRGYSIDNLQWMRKFYVTYQKYEMPSHKSTLEQNEKYETLVNWSCNTGIGRKLSILVYILLPLFYYKKNKILPIL